MQVLEKSKTEKRGVTAALGAGPVALVVAEIGPEHVIGRSQQYGDIVVRLDRIQAAFL